MEISHKKQITSIVRKELWRYPSIFKAHSPNRLNFIVRDSQVYWPDCERTKDFLHVMSSFGKVLPVQGTYAHFYLRLDRDPSLLISNLFIREDLRGKGLGNKILLSLESIGQQFGCEERIYLKDVINPPFWSTNDYSPFHISPHSGTDYWKKEFGLSIPNEEYSYQYQAE